MFTPAEIKISDTQSVILFDPHNDNYLEDYDITLTVNTADMPDDKPFMMLVTKGKP